MCSPLCSCLLLQTREESLLLVLKLGSSILTVWPRGAGAGRAAHKGLQPSCFQLYPAWVEKVNSLRLCQQPNKRPTEKTHKSSGSSVGDSDSVFV